MNQPTQPPVPPQQPQGWPLAYQPRPPKKHRFRNVVLSLIGVGVLIGIIAGVASGGSKKDDKPTAPGSPGVSKGIAAHDASADITKLTCGTYMSGLVTDGKIAITNHSGGRSDYAITVVFLDAKGTQLGDGTAFIQHVEAHAKAVTDLVGTSSSKFATCRVSEVQRTAST